MAKTVKKVASEDKQSSGPVYGPTKLARQAPRSVRLRNEKGEKLDERIGLGGEITIPALPPDRPIPVTIREATPEEYARYKHLKHLVQVI